MNRLLPARMLAALRPDDAQRIDVPGDVARRSRRQVSVAALLGLGATAAFLALEASGVAGGSALERAIDLTRDAIALAICLALWIVASWSDVSDRAVRGAALGAEILLCALISATLPWTSFLRTGSVPGITWVVPIVILVPLLVPVAPRAARLVSILSAATMPIGVLVLAATGRVVARPEDVLAVALTAAVASAIALIAAHAVHGASRQAAAARMAGSYRLTEAIGRGGMGEVWKAEHALLARPAAVKLILPEQLQGPAERRDTFVARFTREAQVTASLRSPHTVELFDFGESESGALYYAMELLEGINLEHYVYRFGAVESRRAIHWLAQICHSLAEAHGRGLVHRDIKPGNLMLCRYGRDCDFVKVLDFGLIKPVDAGDDLRLTSPGFRLGTPGYMSPEQVFAQGADPRSDIYALGCVAYWLVAGQRPFEAQTAAELMKLHLDAAPPPPSRVAPHPVPERFERLVLACLAKDPAQRPADAESLCAELASCDGDSWTDAEARAWWSEHWKK